MVFLTKNAYSDEPRYRSQYYSKDSTFYIKLTSKNSWTVFNKSGYRQYNITDENFISMTIRISNDGKRILVLDDFCENHKMKDRNVFWVFVEGKLKKKYKLTELIEDTCNVSLSVWHLDWLVDRSDFNEDQSKFEISTNEFYSYIIDTYSGEIILKTRPEEFNENTIIAYGTFYQTKGKKIEMKIHKYIFGKKQPNDKIQFNTSYYENGKWTTTLMIKDGVDITPNKFRVLYTLNNCIF